MIISTKDLGIGYQGKKKMTLIICKINIEICKGDFMVVLGRNGIGKSTFYEPSPKFSLHLRVLYSWGKKNSRQSMIEFCPKK